MSYMRLDRKKFQWPQGKSERLEFLGLPGADRRHAYRPLVHGDAVIAFARDVELAAAPPAGIAGLSQRGDGAAGTGCGIGPGTAWLASPCRSAEDAALRIVASSEAMPVSIALLVPDEIEPVTMERSTSAFSRLKPPAPQPARTSNAQGAAALRQDERKVPTGRLSKMCAMRDNRQILGQFTSEKL